MYPTKGSNNQNMAESVLCLTSEGTQRSKGLLYTLDTYDFYTIYHKLCNSLSTRVRFYES
jgi:hypothetical protein